MDRYLKGAPSSRSSAQAAPSRIQSLRESLGGKDNIVSSQAIALTRIRVELKDAKRFRAETLGSTGWQEIRPGLYHLIVGEEAEAIARSL
jgi:PTS system glucose-specific IIC component